MPRPATRIEPRRSGEDTGRLFHENAERQAAASDQLRRATIIIASCTGALPAPRRSMTASTTKRLGDRDMLQHPIAAWARNRCRRPHRHGGRPDARQTEYSTSRTARTLYLAKLHRRMLSHRHHPCREHGDDRKLGSASARSAEGLPCPTFKTMISPQQEARTGRAAGVGLGEEHVFQGRPSIVGTALW